MRIWLLLIFASFAIGDQTHYDTRCLCKCPDVNVVKANRGFTVAPLSVRSVYVEGGVDAKNCDCPSVVVPKAKLTPQEADAFCPRCKCAFQERSLTVMKVVVIIVLWVIGLLVAYMLVLAFLDKKPISGINYRERLDDDDGESVANGVEGVRMRTYAYGNSVMDRVGTQQTKWKAQVQEQRRNIYDRRSMLN